METIDSTLLSQVQGGEWVPKTSAQVRLIQSCRNKDRVYKFKAGDFRGRYGVLHDGQLPTKTKGQTDDYDLLDKEYKPKDDLLCQ
jgi:hypothetical protein